MAAKNARYPKGFRAFLFILAVNSVTIIGGVFDRAAWFRAGFGRGLLSDAPGDSMIPGRCRFSAAVSRFVTSAQYSSSSKSHSHHGLCQRQRLICMGIVSPHRNQVKDTAKYARPLWPQNPEPGRATLRGRLTLT